jgi:hypothetical protein
LYSETATVVKRLWYDPVWSKVIATGITAAIGLLLTWLLREDVKTKWPLIGMAVSGVLFLFFLASYFWGNFDTQPRLVDVATPTAPQSTQQPTLAAIDRSKIDASGAKFTGDLGFPFAKAIHDSVIDMANITVTTNKEGITTVRPGNASRTFDRTGEFVNLSNMELAKSVHDLTLELRAFQKQFDKDFYEPNGKWPTDEKKVEAIGDQYSTLYETKFSERARSLAGELLYRVGPVESSSLSTQAQMGGIVVLHGKFAGPNPALSAAEFLEALSNRLASN